MNSSTGPLINCCVFVQYCTGNQIPALTLSDLRPLKANAPASTLADEGATFYWHLKAIQIFTSWAACRLNQSSDIPSSDAILPGWTYLTNFSLSEPSLSSEPFPLVAAFMQGRHLLILARGTGSAPEWNIDFMSGYASAPAASNISNYSSCRTSLGDDVNFPGHTHAGFTLIALQVWEDVLLPLLKGLLSQNALEGITVSGYSLGAALSTLLSFMAQELVDQMSTVGDKVHISAVLIAPPNVGDHSFVASFNRKVNARRVPFLYDVIPQLPCAPENIACPNTPVDTTLNGTVHTWQYTPVGGTVIITALDMPAQAYAWHRFSRLNLCHIALDVVAVHTCSYSCAFSKFVAAFSGDSCLLDSVHEDTSTPGSFCEGFPVANDSYV
ncbi:hypothetical protein CEUSTIGMA_g3465.t1 [Chlamydomonas eustigma]|uniref:Fungal lipase-type domain-containing protein n=1 Tax=Chlamydomonas eustigma TaxID=1157962 RepID=A0A250WZI0_9CHLO|nr:hypothetical protein CEUSTIGMA_g3465.t1 [Chlamydomonas eustigma]|eukprot:GAX76022.1 hypothetical protein CEUSTIGMA_g3465.t1 [Chlamydomonas eustigma]